MKFHERQLITRRTAMQRYDFPSVNAVRMFAKRAGIEGIRRGIKVVYDVRDFERVLCPVTH